jgi:hypothetical protein
MGRPRFHQCPSEKVRATMESSMSNYDCPDCRSAEKDGHNFCPSCGCHLTAGYAQNPRVSVARYADEQYCGHCGKRVRDCNCQ